MRKDLIISLIILMSFSFSPILSNGNLSFHTVQKSNIVTLRKPSSSFQQNSIDSLNNLESLQTIPPKPSGTTPHSAFTIDGDANLASSGVTGTGSKSDPFVLSSINITVSGNALTIKNTDKYFIIKDSYFNTETFG